MYRGGSVYGVGLWTGWVYPQPDAVAGVGS